MRGGIDFFQLGERGRQRRLREGGDIYIRAKEALRHEWNVGRCRCGAEEKSIPGDGDRKVTAQRW